ncbi:hypothetical protein [Oceanimonas smirnovii]|uniref:hypothetical protein n=1 Tax=Oceanimonas smirnovii TaxID=264574 RepID=UPI003FD42C60
MAAEALLVNNLDDLNNLVTGIREGRITDEQLGGNLASIFGASEFQRLRYTIKGDPNKYNGSLTPTICKALYDFQTELYKIYTSAAYQTENLQRLKAADKEGLEVVFLASEGSLEILAQLESFINTCANALEKVTKGMTGTQKTLLLSLLVLSILGGSIAYFQIEADAQTERQQQQHAQDKDMRQLELKEQQQQHDAELKKMDMIKSGILDALKVTVPLDDPKTDSEQVAASTAEAILEHSAKAHESVLKSVPDADSVSIEGMAKSTLSHDDIIKYVSTPSVKAITKEMSLVIEIDSIKKSDERLVINVHLEGNTDASFTLYADTSFLEPNEIRFLFDCFRDDRSLKVNANTKIRAGVIEKATLISIDNTKEA